MRLCNKPRQSCPLKPRLRSGGSKKSIAYDSCDAASMIRTVLYFEFNSTAASRTKRWKNTGRYRVILIEPTAARVRFPRALAAAGEVRPRRCVFGDGQAHGQSPESLSTARRRIAFAAA